MKQWGKQAAAAVLAASLLCPWASGAGRADAAATTVQIMLDDVPLAFDAEPLVDKGVTFVPFRAIGEALGIGLVWDGSARKVTATGTRDGKSVEVVLQVGNGTALVDGQNVKLPAAPIMVNNRVMIPLSFFSTQFGAKVSWSQETRTVSIVSPQQALHLRAFYALGSFKERDIIQSMNSVAFGWSRIDSNGVFTTEGAEYRIPEPSGDITADSLVSDAAASGIKPYLMVYSGDGNNELTKMLSDASLRSQSITGITQEVQDKGFGGVVLDYEGLGFKLDKESQRKLLNDYVKELREALPKETALSVAVPPPNGAYQGYDYKTLATVADDLIVMAYQYHPAGTAAQVPEPNGKVQDAIRLTLDAGVPKEKLLLGIDMSSETPSSIDDKLGLAKRYDLKGAAFWRLGLFREYAEGMEDAVGKSVTKE